MPCSGGIRIILLVVSSIVATSCGPGTNPDDPVPPPPDFVYWTDHGTHLLQRAPIGGGVPGVVFEEEGFTPWSVAIDARKRLLFFTAQGRPNCILRMALGGGEAARIFEGVTEGQPSNVLALDPWNDRVLFTVQLPLGPNGRHLWALDEIDYNGGGRKRIAETGEYIVRAILPDPLRGRVLWITDDRVSEENNALWSFDRKSGSTEMLIPESAGLGGIIQATLGPYGRWFYFGQAVGGDRRIRRARIDGSAFEDLVVNPVPAIPGGARVSYPMELEIDASTWPSKLYWADINLNRISRSNLDGTGYEVVLVCEEVPGSYATGLALLPGRRWGWTTQEAAR